MSTIVENVELVKQARNKLRNALAEKGLSEEDINSLNSLVDIIAGVSVLVPFRSLHGDIVITQKSIMDMTDETITNASYMFYGCHKLTSLTLPDGFGTAITNASYMFYNCTSLTSLTLPDGFGTAITNAISMFRYCAKLTSLTLPNGFGTAITNASYMFQYCSSLTSLTLPDGFGTAITDASYMFSDCTSLTSLTLPAGFGAAITSVPGVRNMFEYCRGLTDINGDLALKISFSLSSCTKLTHQSLMNVLNSIQTVSTTKTLTLGSTNLAKLTDEEKAIATEKGWSLA